MHKIQIELLLLIGFCCLTATMSFVQANNQPQQQQPASDDDDDDDDEFHFKSLANLDEFKNDDDQDPISRHIKYLERSVQAANDLLEDCESDNEFRQFLVEEMVGSLKELGEYRAKAAHDTTREQAWQRKELEKWQDKCVGDVCEAIKTELKALV